MQFRTSGLQLHDCSVTAPESPAASVRARCGIFFVPENSHHPEERVLPLRVIILPATSKATGLPVYVLPGGPGQQTTTIAPGYVDSAIRNHHDVVFMDLRGAGDGHWLGCSVGGSDEKPQAYIEPLFSQGTEFAKCRDALMKRADLNQYTVARAMEDLDGLREALGHRQIMLSAGSYGTREALVYIRMFGKRVKGAILVAAAPFENRIPLYHAQAAQHAFDELLRECARNDACGRAFPDVSGDLQFVLQKLRREPALVTIKNPANAAPLQVRLSSASFAEGLRVMLYYDETISQIPLLLHNARNGDLKPFAQAAIDGNRALYKSIPLGMLLSYTCSEDVARIRPDEIEPLTKDSFIGDSRARGQMAACSVWPHHPLVAAYRGPFRSDVPMVIVSGTMDPITPPGDGELVRRSFPNSIHLVFRGGHGTGGKCLDQIAADFFDGPDIKALRTGCVATAPPPAFAVPGRR